MKNWLFILFFACFSVSYSFAQTQEEGTETNEEQTEEQGNDEQGEQGESEEGEGEYEGWELGEDTLYVPTPKELEIMAKKTERLAQQIVAEKFKKIDEQRKMEIKEERIQKRLDKQKQKREKRQKERGGRRGRDLDDDDDKPKRGARKEQDLEEKPERKTTTGRRVLFDDDDDEKEYEETEAELYEYYYETGVDTALLRKRVAELEQEMWNVRNIDDAKRGRKGTFLLKLKIPNCYYLNSVIYQRDDFEFIYQLDFFVHYFEHRYHHKKKFYDMGDTTRVIAKQIMNFTGNTKYRKTNLNLIIDSIGSLSGNPISEYLDGVISELNLEYLATGEIKINYKNKNQKKIYAAVKPSDMERRELGHIAFYTWDKKKVIEQKDASLLNAYLPLPEKDYMDSILMTRIPMPIFGDSPAKPVVIPMPEPVKRDILAAPSFLQLNNNIKITPVTISLEDVPAQNTPPAPEKENKEAEKNNAQEKEATATKPVEEKPVVPENPKKEEEPSPDENTE